MARPKRICSVPDCGKWNRAHGYCSAHYERFKTHGDPLAGRINHGDAQRFLRDVVLAYNGAGCLTWPFSQSHGYGQIRLNGELKVVANLVCREVHGEPPTPDHEAAHSCGRGHLRCVSPGHVSWKTAVENAADKLLHGTHNRGERQGRFKLTEANVREIRALKGRMFQRDIAAHFGVSQATVGLLLTGKNWAWLS